MFGIAKNLSQTRPNWPELVRTGRNSVATVGSMVALGCLWMLWVADFLCFLPVRPMPWLRGISVHATAARRTRRGRLLDGDLPQQESAQVRSVVADASGLTRGRGVYREAGLPNTLGCIPAEKSGPEKIYCYTEPYPPLPRPIIGGQPAARETAVSGPPLL